MSFPAPTPKQARIIWFALTSLAVALTVTIVAAIFWGLGRAVSVLSPVLWPIAVAAIIAFILDPVVDALVARRVPRFRAVLLVFGAAGVLVLGAFGSLVPRAVVEAQDLARRIPTYAERAGQRLESWINDPRTPLAGFLPERLLQMLPGRRSSTNEIPALPGTRPEATEAVPESREAGAPSAPSPGTAASITNVASAESGSESGSSPEKPGWWVSALNPDALMTAGDWLATTLPEVGRWALGQMGRVASLFGILAGLALIPIYAFYFLLEKSAIQRQWTDYLPVANSAFKDELVWLLRNINDALIVFFRGQVLVALCDGVLYTIGFLIIGLPYALLLGMMATVLTIVPFLGAIVTCVLALIISIVQFGDWQHPLLVLAVFAFVQTIEGWVIQPKIIGDRVGLHPVTIIIALLVGTTLMGGLLGGLLAIPATAVLRALMFRYVWRASWGGGGGSVANDSQKTG
jgi:predicted PurR-regulated permease PerM